MTFVTSGRGTMVRVGFGMMWAELAEACRFLPCVFGVSHCLLSPRLGVDILVFQSACLFGGVEDHLLVFGK